MKKVLIILIVIAIAMIVVGGVFLFTKKESKPNDKDKVDDPPKETIEDLDKILDTWADTLIENKNYKICVKDNVGCFISIKTLEKKYNYDISPFISEKMHCDADKSGIYFDVDGEEPKTKYLALKDCYSYLGGEKTKVVEEQKS